jgi:hypothetical protein
MAPPEIRPLGWRAAYGRNRTERRYLVATSEKSMPAGMTALANDSLHNVFSTAPRKQTRKGDTPIVDEFQNVLDQAEEVFDVAAQRQEW